MSDNDKRNETGLRAILHKMEIESESREKNSSDAPQYMFVTPTSGTV
jgi:hypothetical protein